MAVKCTYKVISAHVTKAYRGIEVHLHSFLTSARDGGVRWSLLLGRFTPGEENRHLFKKMLSGPQTGSGRFVSFAIGILDQTPDA